MPFPAHGQSWLAQRNICFDEELKAIHEPDWSRAEFRTYLIIQGRLFYLSSEEIIGEPPLLVHRLLNTRFIDFQSAEEWIERSFGGDSWKWSMGRLFRSLLKYWQHTIIVVGL